MIVKHNGRLVKMRFYDFRDCFMATASTSDCSVWNCYGSTKEAAKEMALFRLNQALEEGKELGVEVHRDGYTFFREKKAPLD
ncbi:hypothetical protein J7E63_12785 [Bacillus sp. ISL-75]|uniref:hypothetical protein n=1 Tax=Bacillus sp. ISL-75 TaxID=2819137 RepID=UPI001BE6603A|nr:hypothetical protein [Bacillus sp. ISL-75]MBT2727814.1 hypothetical protein [Bacillus sp. ISL-75]